jgi:hypothetical protein
MTPSDESPDDIKKNDSDHGPRKKRLLLLLEKARGRRVTESPDDIKKYSGT